jgi:prepilin-type N-terminal cleavage/methylation domain-containing protein
MCCGWGSSGVRTREAGFSLIEVLIALAVAGILALGLVTAQGHSLTTTARAEDLWRNINLAQALLAGRSNVACESHPVWVAWPDIQGASWKQSEEFSSDFLSQTGSVAVNREISAYKICRLWTRTRETSMVWDRLVPGALHR